MWHRTYNCLVQPVLLPWLAFVLTKILNNKGPTQIKKAIEIVKKEQSVSVCCVCVCVIFIMMQCCLLKVSYSGDHS